MHCAVVCAQIYCSDCEEQILSHNRITPLHKQCRACHEQRRISAREHALSVPSVPSGAVRATVRVAAASYPSPASSPSPPPAQQQLLSLQQREQAVQEREQALHLLDQLPLPPSSVPANSFSSHGWQLSAPTVECAHLAQQWVTPYRRLREDAAIWTGLKGDIGQIDCTALLQRKPVAEAERQQLLADTSRVMLALLAFRGIDTRSLHLAAIKLLRSFPGDGLQPAHYDTADYDAATQRYSMLLYCGTNMSTAMPRYDAATMRMCFSRKDEISSEELRLAHRLCSAESFISLPVRAGSTMVFNTSVAHHGIRNDTDRDRVAVYCLFSPVPRSIDPAQDEQQRFPLGA